MKQILPFIILFYSTNCLAVSWKSFGNNSMGYSYVDVDSINKRNNIVDYTRLFDYSQTSPIGVNSSISRFTVDCLSEKLTWKSSIYYSKAMGKGKIIKKRKSKKTLYPRPGTIEFITMKFACSYKQLNT